LLTFADDDALLFISHSADQEDHPRRPVFLEPDPVELSGEVFAFAIANWRFNLLARRSAGAETLSGELSRSTHLTILRPAADDPMEHRDIGKRFVSGRSEHA